MKFLGVNVNGGDYVRCYYKEPLRTTHNFNGVRVGEGIVTSFNRLPKKGLCIGGIARSISEEECSCIEVLSRWDKGSQERIPLDQKIVSRGLTRAELHRMLFGNDSLTRFLISLKSDWNLGVYNKNENNYIGLINNYVPEAYILHKRPFGFSARCVDGDLKVLLLGSEGNYHLGFYSKQDK